MVMKVMVTGGAGFIASNIVDRLVNEGNQVVVVDDLSTGSDDNLNAEARFYRMDIRSPELASVFEAEKPDYVNHHAAQVLVNRSVREPMLDCWLNIEGSLNVIHMSQKYGVKKVIYASTGGALYGEPEYLPVDENHPVNPLAPYGVSKHTAEHYLYLYGVNYGLNYTVLRYPNVYGPRQNPHGEAGVIAIFTRKMLDGERPTIFGDGTATRDYVYVGDIVDANILALSSGDRGTYNLGSSKETSVNVIFDLLKAELDFRLDPIFAPKRVGEVYRIFLTNDKAKSGLGWAPNVSIEEGIGRTVKYYRDRPDV
jgi:UDP-glucose 4-epimerase